MSYTNQDIENLAIDIMCCSGQIGTGVVRKIQAGAKVCDCEILHLKYLLRVKKILQCYTPVGAVYRDGVPSYSVIDFPNASAGYDSVKIVSSDGSLNITVTRGLPKINDAIDALVPDINSGTTWTAMYWLNPAGDIVFRIVTPDDAVYCGVTYTISIRETGALVYTDIATGTMGGGACTITSNDVCLTDSDIDKIKENYKIICKDVCCTRN